MWGSMLRSILVGICRRGLHGGGGAKGSEGGVGSMYTWILGRLNVVVYRDIVVA